MLRDRLGESARFERGPRISPLPHYLPRAATCVECSGEFVKLKPTVKTCSDACWQARDERIKARAARRFREKRRAR